MTKAVEEEEEEASSSMNETEPFIEIEDGKGVEPVKRNRRQLGILSVALITYFNVSGGPWGSEPIIASCGPLIGLTAVLIFPWIWCLPLALTFAELFTAFPTDGSFCTWVGHAFGRSTGFQVGFWSWVSGVIDNAIYPCLVVDTVRAMLSGSNLTLSSDTFVSLPVFFIRIAVAILFMLPTLTSIEIVGNTLLFMSILVFFPFGILIFLSIPQIHPSNWFAIRPDMDWSRLISTLYWNYSGFDAAGAYAGEIRNPKTTYPKAMVLTVILIALTYALPFLAVSGVDKPHFTSWDDGSYSVIAKAIGGTWLGLGVVASSIFGNLGLYVAEMAKDGFQLAGMADAGMAPPFFSKRERTTGVPQRAMFVAFFIIAVMSFFNFDTILGVDNFLSALSSVVEMCAAIRMRYSHPDIERPYKVNVSDRSMMIIFALPILVGVFVMVNELLKSWISLGLNLLFLVIGFGLSLLLAKYPYNPYETIDQSKISH